MALVSVAWVHPPAPSTDNMNARLCVPKMVPAQTAKDARFRLVRNQLRNASTVIRSLVPRACFPAGCEAAADYRGALRSSLQRGVFTTVVVTKLDRLARSSRDLHNIVHKLAGLSVGFQSLGEAWCDTTTDVGRLMLTIMGGIAERAQFDPQPHRCGDRAGQASGQEVRAA